MRDLNQEIIKFSEKVHNEGFANDLTSLTKIIANYAHRKQKRINGEKYINHPIRMSEQYLKLIKNIDKQKIAKCDLINKFIIELCYLHDVIEDSDITILDLEKIYKIYGFQKEFNRRIKTPLLLLTHNKKESYEIYINKMIENKEACFVKFLDMNNNLNIFELNKLGRKEEDRAIKYIHYLKVINDKWMFLENLNKILNT